MWAWCLVVAAHGPAPVIATLDAKAPITHVAVAPDDSWVAAVTDDEGLVIWTQPFGTHPTRTLPGCHKGAQVTDAAAADTNTLLLDCAYRELQTINPHTGEARTVDWNDGGPGLSFASGGKHLLLYSVNTGATRIITWPGLKVVHDWPTRRVLWANPVGPIWLATVRITHAQDDPLGKAAVRTAPEAARGHFTRPFYVIQGLSVQRGVVWTHVPDQGLLPVGLHLSATGCWGYQDGKAWRWFSLDSGKACHARPKDHTEIQHADHEKRRWGAHIIVDTDATGRRITVQQRAPGM